MVEILLFECHLAGPLLLLQAGPLWRPLQLHRRRPRQRGQDLDRRLLHRGARLCQGARGLCRGRGRWNRMSHGKTVNTVLPNFCSTSVLFNANNVKETAILILIS